jgi:hypothetical protein
MRTRNVAAVRTLPSAHEPHRDMPCRHRVHLGTCPQCQRAQLARWAEQLADAAPKNG